MAIVDLIESGLGLLKSDADITPQWVEGVLKGSKSLEDNVSVTAVKTERIGEGVGILSILQRVIPTYSGETKAPKTFVVKYPTDDATQRFTADALAFYIRELVFYKECAPDAPFRTAKCYGQAIAGDNTDFTIAMEDIGGFRALNQIEGVSLAESKVLLETLADFHAMWWNSPKLDGLADVFQPVSNPIYHAVLPGMWTGGWQAMVPHVGHLIPESIADIETLWAEKCSWMLETMMAPKTMLHGDFRADNLMFDGDKPAVIDFQICGSGTGMYDVAYFISQSISTDVRRGHDQELIDTYLNRIEKHGIEVDRAEAWRQYLVAVCFCVNYGITTFTGYEAQNDRGKQLLQDMLMRALHCVIDNNAMQVLR